MLLHPCEGYFPCRGVITNLFPVEAIVLVTCARSRSGKMDAPASQFSLLTRNKINCPESSRVVARHCQEGKE